MSSMRAAANSGLWRSVTERGSHPTGSVTGCAARHEARHSPRLRLAPPCSHPRPRPGVAELGVVRRSRISPENGANEDSEPERYLTSERSDARSLPSLFRVSRVIASGRLTLHVVGEFRAAPSRFHQDARECHLFVASSSAVLDRSAAWVFPAIGAPCSCKPYVASYSAVLGASEGLS